MKNFLSSSVGLKKPSEKKTRGATDLPSILRTFQQQGPWEAGTSPRLDLLGRLAGNGTKLPPMMVEPSVGSDGCISNMIVSFHLVGA